MARFLRNFRLSSLRDARLARYGAYAAGEIVLVVVGILLAVQLNDLNAASKLRAREDRLLLELRRNLEANINRLESDIADQKRTTGILEGLIGHLEAAHPWNDSLAPLFRESDIIPEAVLTASAFENLKSQGFDLIRSDALRGSIIRLFEYTYAELYLETQRLEDTYWPSVALPLWIRHFEVYDSVTIPVDFEAVTTDREFRNMLIMRASLRRQSTRYKQQAVVETKKAITAIEAYRKEQKGTRP